MFDTYRIPLAVRKPKLLFSKINIAPHCRTPYPFHKKKRGQKENGKKEGKN